MVTNETVYKILYDMITIVKYIFLKNLKIYFLLGFPGGNSDKKIHL